MSYRALITTRDGELFRDHVVLIGDTWREAEEFAHQLAATKSFEKADAYAAPSRRNFSDAEHRRDWIDTYADQTWEVRFERKGEYIHTTITGKDAGGEDIFMRRILYHTGAEK
jgi:hypothetical protein